jgi:uncharacterized damage-inducible protein DinB
MTNLAPDPSVTADEAATLDQFLDYYRSVLLRKADGLDDAQARERVAASSVDILGLIRHMALVEQWWFSIVFSGREEPEWWFDPDDRDHDWHHTVDDTLAEAVTALITEIGRSRETVAFADSLDQLSAIEVGPPERHGRRSLRWVMVHMIEEYARHCGHADFLREAIDGTVGD